MKKIDYLFKFRILSKFHGIDNPRKKKIQPPNYS